MAVIRSLKHTTFMYVNFRTVRRPIICEPKRGDAPPIELQETRQRLVTESSAAPSRALEGLRDQMPLLSGLFWIQSICAPYARVNFIFSESVF